MLYWENELEKIIAEPWPIPNPFRKISERGIVLYGAGSMGQMAVDFFALLSIRPLYIVDRNLTGVLNGIPIILPEQIPENDRKTVTFIICIVTSPMPTIVRLLAELGCTDIRHFYDCSEVLSDMQMTNGWAVPSPSQEQLEGIRMVCLALNHDQWSLAHYLQFLWWRLRRQDLSFTDYPVLSNKRYFIAPSCPVLHSYEYLIDGGSHHGQNLTAFLTAVHGKFDHILAFEPDPANLLILRRTLETFSPEVSSRISVRTEALSKDVGAAKFRNGLNYASKIDPQGNQHVATINLDSFANIKPTIIRLHIEGSELPTLLGAEKAIRTYRPILMIIADHTVDGLFKIGAFLSRLDNYKLFFHLHDYCGNSAVFYAYPLERLQ